MLPPLMPRLVLSINLTAVMGAWSPTLMVDPFLSAAPRYRPGRMAQVEEPGDHDVERVKCIIPRAALEEAKSLVTFNSTTGIFTLPMSQRANFLAFTGPPEVVFANLSRASDVWDKERVFKKHDVTSRTATYLAHSDRDVYYLTEAGKDTLRRQEKMTKFVVNVVYECGKLKRKGDGERPNCHRTICGGQGGHTASCSNSKCKGCAFRVKVTATLQQVQQQIFQVELIKTHVPVGEIWHPPGLANLRVARCYLEDAVQSSDASGSNVKACADMQAKHRMAAEESRPKLPRNMGQEDSPEPEPGELESIAYYSAFEQRADRSPEYPHSSLTPANSTTAGAAPHTPMEVFKKLVPTTWEVKHAKASRKRSFGRLG